LLSSAPFQPGYRKGEQEQVYYAGRSGTSTPRGHDTSQEDMGTSGVESSGSETPAAVLKEKGKEKGKGKKKEVPKGPSAEARRCLCQGGFG
jgi:hypothetical protein